MFGDYQVLELMGYINQVLRGKYFFGWVYAVIKRFDFNKNG